MSEIIGFVGGGQMATALSSGAIAAGVVHPQHLIFAEPDARRREEIQKRFADSTTVADAGEMLADCDKVILAVKPHVLKQISSTLSSKIKPAQLLVSIAAGISIDQLIQMLGTKNVVRVMPNTPCQIGAGSSALAAPAWISEKDLEWVERFMQSVGLVERIPDELMHAFTGIAGSSPAYIYIIIEALSDGGVAQGLSRPLATRMAAQAVLGAARMVLESGLHPGELKDQVTSPGGTTIAALGTLESCGVRSAFIEAVARCTDKSRELGS